MKRLIAAASAALMLMAAPVIAAEAPTVYIWISFIKAKPGQGDALVKEMIKEDGKTLDALVDGGQALDWGVAMPIFHDGKDPYSHVEWVSFNGWAGADAFMNKFAEVRKAMGEAGNKAAAERWAAMVEPGSHADLVLRVLHNGQGTSTEPERYIDLSYTKAQPGKFGDLRRAYIDYVPPVNDKLVADGTILAYGLATPAVHRGEDWTFMSWTSLSNLTALDKIEAAFDAAEAARSEEENKTMQQRFQDSSDWSGHRDQTLMVLHRKVSEPK
jgi:hypothetical protein